MTNAHRMLVLLLLAPLLAAAETAAERSTGPVFADRGPVFDVEVDYTPPVEEYRALFDVWIGPDDPSVPNPRFEALARFMNMNAREGVAVEDLHLALVVHGSAGRAVLDDDAYRARFGVANPDREVLDALAAAGVRMMICGQSAAYRGYEKEEMIEPVQVALSAYTAIYGLRAEGYQLMPSWN